MLDQSMMDAKNILESITDAFFALNKRQCFTYVNKEAELLLKKSRKKLLGKYIWNEFIEAEGSTFYIGVNKALRKQTSVCFEEYYPPLENWFSVCVYPTKYGLSIYFRDITRIKKIEKDLRESKDRLSKIIETVPNGIIITNVKGKITFVNQRVEKLLGLKRDQMKTKNYNSSDFNITTVHGKKASDHDLPINLVLKSKKSVFNIEHSIEKPDGSRVILSVNASPLYDEQDKINGVLASITDITERISSEQKLKEANELLKKLSTRDGLTGISNRRHFNEIYKQEWLISFKESLPITLILFDIDHFKIYNDSYGHQCGDDCLKIIASSVDLILNSLDSTVARYGGEEFAIIVPERDQIDGSFLAEKIRKTVENLKIPHKHSPVKDYVTISLGVATIIPNNEEPSDLLLKEADQALYIAKEHGRNQVKVTNIG